MGGDVLTTMGGDLLTNMLAAFQAVVSLGVYKAGPATFSLFKILATIEIAALGLWWLYSHDNMMGLLIFRVITLSFFLWLMQDWQILAGIVQASFLKLGIILGGDHLSLGQTHGAGAVLMNKGQELALAMQGRGAEAGWWQSVAGIAEKVMDTPAATERWIMSWLVAIIFLLAGVHVFVTQLVFVFGSAIAFVTVPFATWNRTAWVAERTFGTVIATGVKLTFLYMLTSASIPVLQQYVPSPYPTQREALSMVGTGFLILCLQIAAGQMAAGILSGMPSLTHSDVLPRASTVLTLATSSLSIAASGLTRAVGALTQAVQGARQGRESQLQLPFRRGSLWRRR